MKMEEIEGGEPDIDPDLIDHANELSLLAAKEAVGAFCFAAGIDRNDVVGIVLTVDLVCFKLMDWEATRKNVDSGENIKVYRWRNFKIKLLR